MYDLFLLSSVSAILASPFLIDLFLNAQQARTERRTLSAPDLAEEKPIYTMDFSPTLD